MLVCGPMLLLYMTSTASTSCTRHDGVVKQLQLQNERGRVGVDFRVPPFKNLNTADESEARTLGIGIKLHNERQRVRWTTIYLD